MTYSTELIVLNHTKFGENSVVLHTLSRAYGRRSFLVRTGSKAGMALFLPLNLLEAVISENPRATLWHARSLTVRHPLAGIRGNLLKNTITLFMSEVLYRTIRDGADPDGLVDWCERSILTLDALESGHLGGAALDTIENEANLYYRDLTRETLPNRDRAALMALPNVVVTPHMAFYTQVDVQQMVATSCSALLAFSRGEDTPYEVR